MRGVVWDGGTFVNIWGLIHVGRIVGGSVWDVACGGVEWSYGDMRIGLDVLVDAGIVVVKWIVTVNSAVCV